MSPTIENDPVEVLTAPDAVFPAVTFPVTEHDPVELLLTPADADPRTVPITATVPAALFITADAPEILPAVQIPVIVTDPVFALFIRFVVFTPPAVTFPVILIAPVELFVIAEIKLLFSDPVTFPVIFNVPDDE
jgi:hypothetical protein